MDRNKVQRLRCALSAHLTLLALVTTIVVATGSGSIFMPCLILLVGIFSFVFVDWMEWFSLHRSLAYLGMVVGTVASMADYCWGILYADSPTHQLYAVASLLVYPQAVLLMQRKNMRIFEQLAVFLLLEVVVASLVNDSLLFGMLLAPIVLLWVSSLFLLARYTAIIRLDRSLEVATPRLVELISNFFWNRHFAKRPVPQPAASIAVFPMRAMGVPRLGNLLPHTLPIGLAASVFACLYFGLLPRMEGSNYSIPQPSAARTGFSRSLTLGMTGKMLQDRTAVLRLKLTDVRSGKRYLLNEPPYIRGAIFGDYGLTPTSRSGEYSWMPLSVHSDLGRLPELAKLRPHFTANRDAVRARFEVLGESGAVFSIAPFFTEGKRPDAIAFYPFEWRVSRSDEYSLFNNPRNSYEFGTLAFSKGANVSVIPFDDFDFSNKRGEALKNAYAHFELQLQALCSMTNSGSQYQDRQNFQSLIALKERILGDAQGSQGDPVRVARTLQDYFVHSGEFTYSLDLTMQRDLLLNPVEDFIANQKQGHCQYFASALALMLRHSGIPARLVSGFHPNEFNQLGKYFVVRNSDAHVWVEAFFTGEQIEASGLNLGFPTPRGCWMTLDPTPSGDGSSAGSELREPSDQAIDYAQQLWSDYVIEANHFATESSFYASVAAAFSEAYKRFIDETLSFYNAIRRGELLSRFMNRENWFSWPPALLAVSIVGGSLFVWRVAVVLPRFAPRLAVKIGLRKENFSVAQPFFVKCLKLLSQMNFRRGRSQTPQELTQSAALYLSSQQPGVDARDSLSVLTAMYYQSRFSQLSQLSKNETHQIERALIVLEKSVRNR